MDVLRLAKEYKELEKAALDSLETSGAFLSDEIITDTKERLAFRRSYVCSLIFAEYKAASKKKRREILAAFDLVNSA